MPTIIPPFKGLFQPDSDFPNSPDNLDKNIDSDIEQYRDTKSLRDNQPYLVDLVTLEKLHFQTIPERIDYQSESSFATLESPGRNNPLYHYTGSEDIISFTITWYGNHYGLQDVIRKCKWLMSLSRSDGYRASIHPCKLIFGEMFKNSKYIVTAAPFGLREFDRVFGMFPRWAEQQVTLKKISETNTERPEQLNPNY